LLRRLITGFESKEKLDLDKIRFLYESLCARHGQSPQGLQLSEAEQRLSRMIPERTGEGRKHADIPETNKVAGLNYGSYETFNFIDGKRSILDIAHALFSEYGVVGPADMEEFIQAQVKAGNLKLRESGSLQKPVGGKKG
jgi:hypothetical protein